MMSVNTDNCMSKLLFYNVYILVYEYSIFIQ